MVCDCSPPQVRGAPDAHSAAALRCMQVLTTTPLSSPHRYAALRMLIRLQARFRSRRLRREQRAQQEALAAKLTQRRGAVLIQRRWRDELERRVLQTSAVRAASLERSARRFERSARRLERSTRRPERSARRSERSARRSVAERAARHARARHGARARRSGSPPFPRHRCARSSRVRPTSSPRGASWARRSSPRA